MGWVWRDEPDDAVAPSASDGDRCSARKVVRSQCKTEEVEPGKFIRKCEKTEEIFKDCVGRPTEVVKSNTEYTEEDVTEQVTKGSFRSGSLDEGPFNFPGLRSDIEAIERQFFGGIERFFDAAEDMKNSFFNAFGEVYDRESSSSRSSSRRRGVPIERNPEKEAIPKSEESSGHVDLSGLARDV